MENKTQEQKLRAQGYLFYGAWISKFASEEEMKRFKERRTELKKDGLDIKTVKEKDGTALWVRRKEE